MQLVFYDFYAFFWQHGPDLTNEMGKDAVCLIPIVNEEVTIFL